MSEPRDTTMSIRPAAIDAPARELPFLCVALEGARPTAPSARFSLAGRDIVRLGRGAERSISEATSDGRRALAISVPDPGMSSAHAVLERELGRWIVRDAGSKNGTRVDGDGVDRATLRDGALIELGNTFVLFSHALAPDEHVDLAAHPASSVSGLDTIVPALGAELDRLRKIAAGAAPILIRGETGTGKDVAARAAHALSGRSGPFVAVNCGAIPASLVESELFGARRGAFSGAVEDRIGLVRSAEGGTLFLDEIGDLPAASQAALLRVLQEGEVVPVGGTAPMAVDFRLVSATLHDLEQLVTAGRFRRDLYARVCGFELRLPPLRSRREDLGSLCGALLRRIHGAGAGRYRFSLDAARAICRYEWPMNIRELEHALSTATALAAGGEVELAHLPASMRSRPAPPSGERELSPDERLQRDALVEALRTHHGNVSAVARATGKARMQIQRWLRRYGIDPAKFRA
jgi:transcriptional regulator with GAF, ATPase, and Fis domain